MKKYEVMDEQGCNFMDYTHEEPMTANELRHHFWCFDECRTNHYKDFTMDYITEMWNVTFVEIISIDN